MASLKNLVIPFKFNTPEYVVVENHTIDGSRIECKLITFKDSSVLYLAFFYLKKELFYMELCEVTGTMMTSLENNTDDIIKSLIRMVDPIFSSPHIADQYANDLRIKNSFNKFKEAYYEICSLYEDFQNGNDFFTPNFPTDIVCSFDESGIPDWCNMNENLNEFLLHLINKFELGYNFEK